MTEQEQERLSLAEWLVLCLIREEPTYGLVLVGLLARDGSLGQVWSVPKAVIYRALQRLEALGLIRTVMTTLSWLKQADRTQPAWCSRARRVRTRAR